MVCAFLGEYENPAAIRSQLKWLVMSLAMALSKPIFFVGTHTELEKEVLSVLREVKREYYGIYYGIVTSSADESITFLGENTICPERAVPCDPKDAIRVRNRWLIQKADIIVYNWKDNSDEACQWISEAAKRGKDVINISVDMPSK